jgi:hypothetical protein
MRVILADKGSGSMLLVAARRNLADTLTWLSRWY